MNRPDVLDASALLAYLQDEQGAEHVELAGARMSAVNFAEVVQKSMEKDVRVAGLYQELELLGLRIVAFDAQQAEASARMYAATRAFGLSFADRACLALAQAVAGTAVTADRTWDGVDLDVPIRLIR